MKQINTLYHNNTHEILGRVTLKGKNVFNRSNYILVSDNEKDFGKGYKFIITSEGKDNNKYPHCIIDSISAFCEGDVVSINSKGEIFFLYEVRSTSNAVFATARCNHRCIMCPQPPVDQEKDRTNFNLELIKLFDKNTLEVGITGGEPTMVGDRLFDLIRQIKKSCPKAAISILSNGVKFADIDYAAKLAACNHHDLQIDIPIFSDIAAEHDRIVGAKTFYKTVQGLYNLARFGQPIGIRIVVHKQTYRRLVQLSDFIYHNFPFVVQVAFMQMETTGLAERNLHELWIDPYDYNHELKQAVLLLNDRGITTYIYNAQLCVLSPELRPFAKQSISEWKDVYLPICEGCSLKSGCAGIFSTNNGNISAHIQKIECADSCTE
ncbi:His-Xaa-Ser system radical SAM maturase HxsC [Prevotella sp. HJM029]|jgi:paired radical SAM protein 2|uniref:His-Xaa-Ser system radical SAM maturase HxsC n=1 Tax=Prevotella sp. HJM029 TaxID=1433844 RepID=UPI0004917F33|nr:His-Xaa-Ser system radical SAM maturase HxsC [Prevotella sp. HJM029]MBF1467737.1 His-Xaa-Ser system radical SAM maturase HxsC [Prevotella pallens]